MSIYSDCSQAISDLAELSEVFTEIDVVNHAADDGWNKAMFKEARKYANQIVSAKYRSGELVRFGPVEYQGTKDYARRAGMIVYGGVVSGPTTWTTPNGAFPQVHRHEDQIQSSGRRKGTARHDEQLWSEQSDVPDDIRIVAAPKGSVRKAPAPSDAQREIERLNVALSEATSRVAELERLLEAKDAAPTEPALNGAPPTDLRHQVESIVLELVADFDGRLGEVEERVQRFTAAFTSTS